VKKNYLGIAKSLIAAGAPVNAVSKGGLSVLHFATESRNKELVEYLINCGASVNQQADNGLHCLHLCSQQGLVNIAKVLIQNQSVINPETKSQYTPIHTASFLGQTKMVEYLAKNGALVNAQTKRGKTPLFLAAERGYLKIAQCLLANKAKDIVDKTGKSALAVAIIQGNNNMVDLLKRFGFAETYGNLDVDSSIVASQHLKTKSKSSAQLADLHTACRNGYVSTVSKLLQQGVNPNDRSKHDLTPLHISVHYNMFHIIKILLEHGADPNAQAQNGYTPLAIACSNNQVQVAQALLQHNADPDIDSNRGITPLMLASKDDNSQLVQSLLSYSASVDKQAKNGVSALHLCCQEDNISAARVLVENGADVSMKTNAGYDPVSTCAHFGSINTLKFLIKLGCSVNSTSRKGRTALMEAAEQGHLEACQVLLASGAVPNLIDDQVEDAFTIAEKNSHANICKTLEPLTDKNLNGANDRIPSENQENNANVAKMFGFLLSFNVDARGAAMHGGRHGGLTVVIPPKRVSMPTRITCKLVQPEKISHPPALKFGEDYAGKVVEMGPPFMTFNGPIMIEVPYFASLQNGERELLILTQEKDGKWCEYSPSFSEKEINATVTWSLNAQAKDMLPKTSPSNKTIQIFTNELPQYLAVISRLKLETVNMKPGGITVSPTANPRVMLSIPEGGVSSIDIQVKNVSHDLTKSFGDGLLVSPLVLIEPPPKSWSDKDIALSVPFPDNCLKSTNNLKLLTYKNDKWIESTYSKSIDPDDKNVARFSCDEIGSKAIAAVSPPHLDCKYLVEEIAVAASKVPYIANFIVYAKKEKGNSAKMHVACAVDEKARQSLSLQENCWEVSRSKEIEVFSSTRYLIRIHGNLHELSNTPNYLIFNPFKENPLPLNVQIKDASQPPIAGISIWQELKDGHDDLMHVCNINMQIPECFETDGNDQHLPTEILPESSTEVSSSQIKQRPDSKEVPNGSMYLVQSEGVQEIVILDAPKSDLQASSLVTTISTQNQATNERSHDSNKRLEAALTPTESNMSKQTAPVSKDQIRLNDMIDEPSSAKTDLDFVEDNLAATKAATKPTVTETVSEMPVTRKPTEKPAVTEMTEGTGKPAVTEKTALTKETTVTKNLTAMDEPKVEKSAVTEKPTVIGKPILPEAVTDVPTAVIEKPMTEKPVITEEPAAATPSNMQMLENSLQQPSTQALISEDSKESKEKDSKVNDTPKDIVTEIADQVKEHDQTAKVNIKDLTEEKMDIDLKKTIEEEFATTTNLQQPLNEDPVEKISIHASEAKTDIIFADFESTDSVQILESLTPVSSTSKTSTKDLIPSDTNAIFEKVAEPEIVNDVSVQDMQEFQKIIDVPSATLPIISADEIVISGKIAESLMQSDMQQLSGISEPESAIDVQGQDTQESEVTTGKSSIPTSIIQETDALLKNIPESPLPNLERDPLQTEVGPAVLIEDSTVGPETDGSPDNGKLVEQAMICQKSASSREKHIEILKEFTEPTSSIQEEKLAEGKPLGLQDLTKDAIVEKTDTVHPTNLQQVNDEILLIPDITPQENSLREKGPIFELQSSQQTIEREGEKIKLIDQLQLADEPLLSPSQESSVMQEKEITDIDVERKISQELSEKETTKPQESASESEVSKDSTHDNVPAGKESDEKQEEEISQRIPGRNMMKRQDTLRHETSYDEIPTGSIEKQSDLGVMADKVNEDDEPIQSPVNTKEEAKSSEETFRAVFLETFNETKQEVPVVVRSSKNEKRLETIPSMTSETDEFATDDELILDDDDRMLNILDEEQLALLNKVTAATRLSDVTEDDVANVEILELFLSSMQESLEGSVEESLRKVETFMEEHSLSENITKKLQDAIITAEEALDSASAIPLTLDDVDAHENREDTPIGEQIDNTLEKKQIKIKHGYDQDFELNRVTQLAGIAQLAQVELQKRMNKKQSESDDKMDDIAAEVDESKTATKTDESSHSVESASKTKNKLIEQESKTPERNMRASSHEAMCETEEILSQIFAKADQDIELNREEVRHVRAQSSSVVLDDRYEQKAEATLPNDRHVRARSHEAASEMEETLSQIFGKALTLSQDMIAKESGPAAGEIPNNKAASIPKELTSAEVSRSRSRSRSRSGIPDSTRKTPIISQAKEEEILAKPADAQNFAILESVASLEKEKNVSDIATTTVQNKPNTTVVHIDAPKICINKVEDEETIIMDNIALVQDPDSEWSSLVESVETEVLEKENIGNVTPVKTENLKMSPNTTEDQGMKSLKADESKVSLEASTPTDETPLIAKDGKWLVGEGSFSPVKKATSMQEIPTKRFGNLTEEEKNKVQKKGSGIIVDDDLSVMVKDAINSSYAPSDQKEKSPDSPTEMSEEWTLLIKESIKEAKAELNTNQMDVTDDFKANSSSDQTADAEIEKELPTKLKDAETEPSDEIPKEIIKHMIDVHATEVEKIARMKLSILQELKEKEALLKRMEEEEIKLKTSLKKNLRGSVSENNLESLQFEANSLFSTNLQEEKNQSPHSVTSKAVPIEIPSVKVEEKMVIEKPIVTKEPPVTKKSTVTEKPTTTGKSTVTKDPTVTEKLTETGKPTVAETISEMPTETRKITEKPALTENTAIAMETTVTKKSTVTEKSAVTEKPIVTGKPTVTKDPTVTVKPTVTGKPTVAEMPTITSKPTEKPAVTEKTAITKKATVTDVPTVTGKPAVIEKPAATEKPAVTEKPVAVEKVTEKKFVETESKPEELNVETKDKSISELSAKEKKNGLARGKNNGSTVTRETIVIIPDALAVVTNEKATSQEIAIASVDSRAELSMTIARSDDVKKVDPQPSSKSMPEERQPAARVEGEKEMKISAKTDRKVEEKTEKSEALETIEYEAISSKITKSTEMQDILAFKEDEAKPAPKATTTMVVASPDRFPRASVTDAATKDAEEEEEMQMLQIINPFVIGQSARLMGEVDPKDPRAKTTWFKDKQQIPLPSRRFLTILKGNTRQFIIHNVQEEDMGFYEMWANGKPVASVFLGEICFRF